MTEQEVKEKYRALLNDPEFDKIELELRTPNIFQILKISRTEIRHSNFLAWLLDPNETHGLGKLFLIKFLRELATSEINGLDEFEVEKLNFHNVEIKREWNNIDLLIIFDTLVICVENKVDSQDHSHQLSKYRKIVNENFKNHNEKVYVYLTPTGEEPNDETERGFYTTFSYEKIISHADIVLEIHGKALNPGVYQYISDYVTNLKREITMNDTSNELAVKIYKNHKELFDFVLANKPDIATKLYEFFEKKIQDSGWEIGSKHKGYARFLTKALATIIPKKGQGWPSKECFLFEIDFFWSKKKAIFKTIISPSDTAIQEVFCKAIEKALKNEQGYKKPQGKQWLVHFQHSWKFDTEGKTEVDEIEDLTNLDEEWEKITAIVKKVEAELIECKAELEKFC